VVLKYLPAGEIYIPGPEEALRLDRRSQGKQALPFWLKLAVVLALAAGAAVLVMVLRAPAAPPAPLAKAEGADPVGQLLKEAKALLANGEIERAMQRASGIPESSNLRASADFRAIQGAWADSLFEKAARAADPSEKRALLDRIATTPSVDPARRKRAADELEALSRAAVDIADLPSDREGSNDAPAVSPATAPAPAPKKPPTAAPTEKTPAPAGGSSLVRKSPF
jgi:hypothetical protein